ncbi:AMP-binding protein [Tsukamurella tyrosinosolvens]|uniref:AMP-binding protein n=1 Tax=Tsukamurella tyrosinosolvens TaxID=57704 RepID=UPI000C7E92E9|nr:AMP-binding protein [Tsukamurella tyrosinosolvens]AUN41813.1 acyl-CoA synthetase [Tsukamurella tyrosinosolvens]
MTGLDTPLTPLRFLQRAAEVMPDKVAVVDGTREWTYLQFRDEVQTLARALRQGGVTDGERVAYLATNSAELLIAHYAVPLARGVLVAINTRLSPSEIEYICRHSEAMLLFGEPDLMGPLQDVALNFPTVTEWIELPHTSAGTDARFTDYASVLRRGDGAAEIAWEVDDETRTISINYTSGTTGRPKGVMYSHRGAYLSSLGTLHHSGFTRESKYLWTLPMFHCNGWCATWAVTAALATHVCLRAVRAESVWALIDEHEITHLSGAPTVLAILHEADEAHTLPTSLTIINGGAPPSPTIIAAMQALGATVVHAYGLTETYGPYAICEPQPQWNEIDPQARAALMARQGVGIITSNGVRVVRKLRGPDGALIDVTPDGREMGEIVMSGNGVMKGYYKDESATRTATEGGWFHSGDLGVMHPDGYVQLLDRAKDVVISGGENISTVEVEHAISSHPAVLEVAVVGTPDERWGERTKAIIIVRRGFSVDAEQIIAHVKSRLASFKSPKIVDFVSELPKTSTGKIRKNELREMEWKTRVAKIN